jgi:hypothetical protein
MADLQMMDASIVQFESGISNLSEREVRFF